MIAGSRGAAAAALRLDYLVDDSAQNCLDVISDSRARPILIAAASDEKTLAGARKLDILTAPAISACLATLEEASLAREARSG